MKHYKVKITDMALNDLEEIYTYIAETLLVPEYAMGQYDRIADAIQSLSDFPERIRLMKSEPEHTMGLRQMQVDNYSVFFMVEGDFVTVTRILYSASDIEKKLSDC